MNSTLQPFTLLLAALLSISAAALQEPSEIDPFAPVAGLQSAWTPSRADERGVLRAYAERADGIAMAVIEFPGGRREYVRLGDRLVLGTDGGLVLLVRELAPQWVRLESTDGSFEVLIR